MILDMPSDKEYWNNHNFANNHKYRGLDGI